MTELPWLPTPLRQLPERLQLSPGTLHLWSIPLDLAEPLHPEWDACLSDDERNRANRFVHARDRRRYRVAHAALRLLLARYTGKDARALSFVLGPQGKPDLEDEHAPAISFNLSHSGELALLGVSSPGRLGVDVEQIRVMEDAMAIARSFFAPAEEAALAAVPLADRDRTFMTCWTRKEAFIKALGGGLSIDLKSFEVSIDREHPAFLRIDDSRWSAQAWSMVHLEPADGYIGALVTDAAVNEIRLMRFDPVPLTPA
jgi:4'-phosphopantetheinyl transferase